jgi:hypothetical protein
MTERDELGHYGLRPAPFGYTAAEVCRSCSAPSAGAAGFVHTPGAFLGIPHSQSFSLQLSQRASPSNCYPRSVSMMRHAWLYAVAVALALAHTKLHTMVRLGSTD